MLGSSKAAVYEQKPSTNRRYDTPTLAIERVYDCLCANVLFLGD